MCTSRLRDTVSPASGSTKRKWKSVGSNLGLSDPRLPKRRPGGVGGRLGGEGRERKREMLSNDEAVF